MTKFILNRPAPRFNATLSPPFSFNPTLYPHNVVEIYYGNPEMEQITLSTCDDEENDDSSSTSIISKSIQPYCFQIYIYLIMHSLFYYYYLSCAPNALLPSPHQHPTNPPLHPPTQPPALQVGTISNLY